MTQILTQICYRKQVGTREQMLMFASWKRLEQGCSAATRRRMLKCSIQPVPQHVYVLGYCHVFESADLSRVQPVQSQTSADPEP